MRAVLLALALLGAAPAAAGAGGQSPAGPAAAEAPSQGAVALAELVTPLELFVEAEVTGAREGFTGMAQQNEEVKALETEYPGIVAYVFGQIEPMLREYSAQQRPVYVARLAQLYHSMLTPPEIATMDAYYRTDTGRRTIQTMFTAVDLAPMVSEMAANPEGEISAKAMASATAAAKRKIVAELGPADEAAVKTMLKGISMAKIQTVGAAVQKLAHQMMNESDPEMDARLDEAAGAAFEKFIAQHEKTR